MKYILVFIFFYLLGCAEKEPNYPSITRDYTYLAKDTTAFVRQETVYVPVYSDIYIFDETSKYLLAITLSLRNTSPTDSLFISYVDYYDSKGSLLRHYLEGMIALRPLESVEFVVENREDKGGTGANFLVHWGMTQPASPPVIQAVMIGSLSQQGISLVTEGMAIERKVKPQAQDSLPPPGL